MKNYRERSGGFTNVFFINKSLTITTVLSLLLLFLVIK